VQKTKPHLCKRFIFITAYRHDPRVSEFLQKINGFALFKPVSTEDLIREISLALKRG
jgi:hypothetical protein